MLTFLLYVAIAFFTFILNYLYFQYIRPKPNTEFEEQTKLIADLRESITSYILDQDINIFNAIAKQKTILFNNNRTAVAIFLSVTQFEEILKNLIDNKKLIDDVKNALLDLYIPIAFIGELPVFVSPNLIDAPVFVAGGIHWDL